MFLGTPETPGVDGGVNSAQGRKMKFVQFSKFVQLRGGLRSSDFKFEQNRYSRIEVTGEKPLKVPILESH